MNFIIDVVVAGDSGKQAGRLISISRGGAFLNTELILTVGARFTLIFDLPGLKGPSEIPCVVRWTTPDKGVGIQFERLKPIEVWSLNKLMHSLSANQEGERGPRAQHGIAQVAKGARESSPQKSNHLPPTADI